MVCPAMRAAEENSEQKARYLPIARFGWGFPKITAIRSRRRGENCVSIYSALILSTGFLRAAARTGR